MVDTKSKLCCQIVSIYQLFGSRCPVCKFQILLLIAAVFYVRTKLRRTWPFGLKLGQSTFEEESDNEELADEDFVE